MAEAARYIRQSAEHGYALGMLGWGGLLALGKGVPQDKIEAYKWLLLALPHPSDRDYPSMKEDLDRLGKRMKKKEIEEAKRRQRNWQPTPPTIDVWTKIYYEGVV